MLKAITEFDFSYTFENFKSLLVGADAPESLIVLAKEIGGTSSRIELRDQQAPRRRPAHTHEERVVAWDGLIADLQKEMHQAPDFPKLTLG